MITTLTSDKLSYYWRRSLAISTPSITITPWALEQIQNTANMKYKSYLRHKFLIFSVINKLAVYESRLQARASNQIKTINKNKQKVQLWLYWLYAAMYVFSPT